MHLAHQPDTKPHSSIQTWSRGPIFPAVIKRVEEYATAETHRGVLLRTQWHVLLNGKTTSHGSYDLAEQHARHQVVLDKCRENAAPRGITAAEAAADVKSTGASKHAAESVQAIVEAWRPKPRVEGYVDDVTGRVAVTVKRFAASDLNDGSVTVYAYNARADEVGMDPWRLVEGVDPMVDGSAFDVWGVAGWCLNNRPPEYLIYLTAKDYARL